MGYRGSSKSRAQQHNGDVFFEPGWIIFLPVGLWVGLLLALKIRVGAVA
jgi:hypothetical protein